MKLLVTGAYSCSDEQLIKIKDLGYEISFLQYEKDQLPVNYEDVEGVICNGLFLHHPIEKFKNLKFIQLTSAGFDRVPMDYIKAKNIKISNARDVYSIPMAEYVIAGVLQLYKKLDTFKQNQNSHFWKKEREILELNRKKVLIVGCGNVGKRCAKLFSAFDCDVLGVDIFTDNKEFFKKIYNIADINDILPLIDIVVLTLPLTDETRQFFGEEKFALMKNGSVLVNISRGAIVKTSALITALKTKLLGAVVDVFEEEPLGQDSELWDIDNVVLTPHNSFVGENNINRLDKVVLSNLENFVKR